MAREVIIAIAFTALLGAGSFVAAFGGTPDLSLERRVAAQRAIEEVLWRHRIWPKENPGAKPPLDAVLPASAIAAKVEDYLRKSNALAERYGEEITAARLQAELDRMASGSQDAAVLRELFESLGNDARLVAETLVRQSMVDRMIRDRYASDVDAHREARQAAEAARARCQAADCMASMGGVYTEVTLRAPASVETTAAPPGARSRRFAVALDAEQWIAMKARLGGVFGMALDVVPELRPSEVEETADGFVVTAIRACTATEVTLATSTWPKRSFDDWWKAARAGVSPIVASPAAIFTLPRAIAAACTSDAWTPTISGVPDARFGHTTVCTGTEMIVWGGYTWGSAYSGGGRYNPATDTWIPLPGNRFAYGSVSHVAVWTGTEMITWDGSGGLRFDPLVGVWTAVSRGANAPLTGDEASAVWTGTQMIVWGGEELGPDTFLNSGGRYTPATDSWAPMTALNAPTARARHTAVWTGYEMVVWGGQTASGTVNNGARYDPYLDLWLPISAGSGTPAARMDHTAVWTGTEMIVWGGRPGNSGMFADGGRYNPRTDSWSAIPYKSGAPYNKVMHTAVWTGSEMIVWGGYDNVGGRYDPSSDSWRSTSTFRAPQSRLWHTAVWTGTEMIVWGGVAPGSSTYFNSGGRYNPSTDSWRETSTMYIGARKLASGVWTGSEMIIWGGELEGAYFDYGAMYVPATDSFVPMSFDNLPSARDRHSALWTGTEMIIWGGNGAASNALGTGARYNPQADTWSPTAIDNTIAVARRFHTAVWTGTEMIIWGGVDSTGARLNSGARYSPGSDSWVPTDAGPTAPSARFDHSAVWTESRMVIWGGSAAGGVVNTGAQYDPATDAWTATSTDVGVPAARSQHAAVWSGSELVVWGGQGLISGGRYNPVTDTWRSTSTGSGVPSSRERFSVVWTGSEMIIWGGSLGDWWNRFQDGGRYNPTTDTWIPIAAHNDVPIPRDQHVAVWTGSEMIVWGGSPYTSTGARYCLCNGGFTVFRDTDGDGFGNSSDARYLQCNARYDTSVNLLNSDDCDDRSRAVHPHAAEDCYNGVDDDCNGLVDGADPACQLIACPDADADGVAVCSRACTPAPGKVCGDCSDANAAIHPGATETCNGIDENCSGQIDEGALGAFSRDADGDGFGVARPTILACSAPAGFVSDHTDCDDTQATTFPGAPELCDGRSNNCSAAGWPTVPASEIDADGDGYSPCAGDCDDTNPAIYPGAPEICDGLNNNCEDPAWPALPAAERDADGDGFRGCDGDCNDNAASAYPGATEICNGIDDNCDGNVDEGVSYTFFRDADGDGFGDWNTPVTACSQPPGCVGIGGDCDDTRADVRPGISEICDNLRDDNCNGLVDGADPFCALPLCPDDDLDGYSVCSSGCRPGGVGCGDCDDIDPSVYPGAPEACDGVDNNCNGLIDEGATHTYCRDADGDGFGDPGLSLQACSAPGGYASVCSDCNDASASVHPGATESCANHIDDDCNGLVDGADPACGLTPCLDADHDGFVTCTPTCTKPADAQCGECDDANAAVHPGATESCNGVDDNCNGSIDEGVTTTFHRDADGDGHGSPADVVAACSAPAGYVANADDCNDASASVHPGATEACGNGIDDDCNGLVDTADPACSLAPCPDADHDGYVSCSPACATPAGAQCGECDDANASVHPGAAESCNGIDDNCNGSIDEGVTTTFHRDADGDGHGSPTDTVATCSAPAGYVASADDCDDANASVHPGVTEVCNNGIDDDCNALVDGADAACSGSLVPLAPLEGARFDAGGAAPLFRWNTAGFGASRLVFASSAGLKTGAYRPSSKFAASTSWSPTSAAWLTLLKKFAAGKGGDVTVWWGVEALSGKTTVTSKQASFVIRAARAVDAVAPAVGTVIPASGPAPEFVWSAGSPAKTEVLEYSASQSFSGKKVTVRLSGAPTRTTPSTQWKSIAALAGKTGGTVHWRVTTTDVLGRAVSSAPRALVVRP